MYTKGPGITQDYKVAVKWYKLAAEQGLAIAQYSLARNYALGNGVIQDYVRAHMWSNIAASQGFETAINSRYKIEGIMTSSQIEKAQDLARECVAKNYKGC